MGFQGAFRDHQEGIGLGATEGHAADAENPGHVTLLTARDVTLSSIVGTAMIRSQ
jgi:hypothetical protein